MSDSLTSSILQLRVLVGFLGEKSQYAWWATSFWGGPSSSFLDPIFPKSSDMARYHGVVEAARLIHDERLNAGCYHLFRLPEELEQDIHAQIVVSGDSLSRLVSDRDTALSQLAALASSSSGVNVGPKSLGSIGEFAKPATLSIIAGLYLEAFRQEAHVYPYWAG